MLPLFVCTTFLQPLSAALHEADVLLHLAEPYPVETPSRVDEAAHDFRDVLNRFGNVPAAHLGLAKCLRHQGRYREAAAQFRAAGPDHASEAVEAERLGRVARSIDGQIRGRRVIQVIQIPGTRSYVASAGRPRDVGGWAGTGYDRLEILLGRIRSDGRAIILRRRRPRLMGGPGEPSAYDWSSADLYLMRRSATARAAVAVLVCEYPAADCKPCSAEVAEVSSAGFGRRHHFYSLQGATVMPAASGHGMIVVVGPTFKVWWPDTYQWRRDRFAFADREHPEFYSEANWARSDSECDHYYPEWMVRGAIRDVHGQWALALKAWRRAETACVNWLRQGDKGGDSIDPGFFGEARVNLVEIRKRIRWIEAGSYRHMLLYRPYDFDLQVPPFRLGPARGSQE